MYHSELGYISKVDYWLGSGILSSASHLRLPTISPHQHILFEAVLHTLQGTVVVMAMLIMTITVTQLQSVSLPRARSLLLVLYYFVLLSLLYN